MNVCDVCVSVNECVCMCESQIVSMNVCYSMCEHTVCMSVCISENKYMCGYEHK